MPFSSTPTKTWTAGPKQRNEITIPFFGAGTNVTIVRADKGVQWTINTKDQTYFESPLTLPYNPNQPGLPNWDALSQLNPNCTTQIEKWTKRKTIGGIKAKGVREWCKESSEQKRIYWFAPNAGTPAQVQKELTTFAKAQSRTQYAQYPEETRLKAEKFAERIQNPMAGKLSAQDQKKWPTGLLLSMETELNGKITTAFEITKLSTEKIDDSLFEIPAGYVVSNPLEALLKKQGQANQPGGINKILEELQKKQAITK